MQFVLFFFFFIAARLAVAGGFSTAIGDEYPYLISAITTDSAGNTYIVGSRALGSANVQLSPNVSLSNPDASDVFITKLDPGGNVLFTDTFGGNGANTGTAIAVDPAGNIYIAGTTSSNDFPLSNALQTKFCNCTTAFIMKLSGDGATILYSTYFGGQLGTTSISSLAIDAKGNLYLTGTSDASDFPHTPGMPSGPLQSSASVYLSGAIIASISAAGDKIVYSGALSGTSADICFPNYGSTVCESTSTGTAIALDPAGNAYVIGATQASLPTTPGVLLPSSAAGTFVAKIVAGGTGVSYLTYLDATAKGIAVDSAGDAYIGGDSGGGFPVTPGAYQTAFVGTSFDGLVLKLNPSASAIIWATYLGGGNGGGSAGVVNSIAIDAAGNVWTTGLTAPTTIPNTNGWATGTEFVAGLNAAGSALTYSALYPLGTVAQAVAVDPAGFVHVAGSNGFVSAIAPTAAPPMTIFGFQNAFGGGITQRISLSEVIAIYGPGIGPATAATAMSSNGVYPTTLAGVQVAINGINMPLLYVSANQINAVVPMELTAGASGAVIVTNGTTTSPAYPVWIVDFAPQAYPVVLNQDWTVNSQTNPAKSGSVVIFYATGWQPSFVPLADGQLATAAEDMCQGTCQAGSNATVLYGGAAPDIVAGVSQFNVLLGNFSANPGVLLVNISVNNIVSVSPAITQTFASESVWVAP